MIGRGCQVLSCVRVLGPSASFEATTNLIAFKIQGKRPGHSGEGLAEGLAKCTECRECYLSA